MNIGRKIQKLREESGIQAQDIADYLFISRPTLYNYEKGKANVPADSIMLLSKLFNVPVSYFYNDIINEKVEIYCSPSYVKLENMIKRFSEEERIKAIKLLTIAID